MGKGCKKGNSNVYFCARKEAAKYNDRLYSREETAEILGISVSSLSDYELGITKIVPVDKVVRMAELYHCPELKAMYCKNDCPIGKTMQIATEVKGIEGSALKLIKEFDEDSLEEMKQHFVDIAVDGAVSADEYGELDEIMKKMDQLALVISEIRLLGEKILGEGDER